MRSAIHPSIFAAVYWLSAELSKLLRLSSTAQDELFLAAPKVTQAVIAALGDYFTWKFGERIYGKGTNEAWAAVCSIHSVQWNICSLLSLNAMLIRFLFIL